MKRVKCIGIVGRYPTSEGMQTLYDTGRIVSLLDSADAIDLRNSIHTLTGKKRDEAKKQALDFISRIQEKYNIYPIGFATLTDEGRILVAKPWFEAKEEGIS